MTVVCESASSHVIYSNYKTRTNDIPGFINNEYYQKLTRYAIWHCIVTRRKKTAMTARQGNTESEKKRQSIERIPKCGATIKRIVQNMN